ncbi:ATP-binding protein [Selenomonas montiformis]|uniref:ATP-binding protein n=1 Tax=Selenomonas montiformis TaxID=2652285 RepID=UPI003F9C31F2
MMIRRDIYLQKLIDRMGSGLIKVITGIRRCGKSYLLFELFRKYLLEHGVKETHIVSMAFDTFQNRRYRDPEQLMDYLGQHIGTEGTYYVLLDEVQLLKDFPEVLNSLLHQSNIDLYVTGSNSKFLSSDVITELRGRGDEIHIFPLSFAEFMQAYQGDIYHGWAEYLRYGGLPLTVNMNTAEQKSQYLIQLFQETYLKDIQERNRLDRASEMESLLDVLASSIGSLTNPSKIQATFQSKLKSSISVNTIHRYISFLEDAFLIHEAKRYDIKGRKYIGTPIKYYFEDVGLRNARLNFRQVEETHLMENILYNELRMRGYNVDVGSITKRYTDKISQKRVSKQLEVDFVANLSSKRYYVQSAYRLPDEEKIRQEKASLLALDDSFKKIIIVSDITTPVHDDNGILTINILDFLLNPDSLEA